MINSAGTESKYGISISIPNSSGVIGSIDGESVFAETKVRIEVINVGPLFTMDVEGQVKNSPNWYVVTTIVGAITGTLDVSTYDRIRYKVTVADGEGVLFSSGFILNSQPLKFNNSGELLTSASGSFLATFSGLKIRMKVSNITVTDTQSALPVTALALRNSIIIENRGIDSIFIGETGLSSIGASQGWEIPSASSFSTDITDAIVVYAIAEAGKSVSIKVMELA